MNKKEEENLAIAASKYKNVCMCIELFCKVLKNTTFAKILEPITDMKLLSSGYYGVLLGADIWVSKLNNSTDGKFYIRVSNIPHENINSRSNEGWSPLFELEEFDRVADLKAFW